jgi:hypothetical protein
MVSIALDDDDIPSSDASEEETDEFADEEFDKLVAEAGDDRHILGDCAVREAVTYVVCDLVDKVVQRSQPTAEERRIQIYDFFTKRLADKSWKSNQRFPKAGSNKELDQLITRLKFKRRTDASALWRDYKSSKGIIGQIKISTSKEDLLKDFKMRSAKSSIVEDSISSTHRYFHADFHFSGESFKRQLYDNIWNHNATCLGELINSRVDDLNNSLACTMHKLTNLRVNKTMLGFVNQQQDEAELFAEKCVAVASKSSNHYELLMGWFLWLDKIVQEYWTIAIKEFDNEDLLKDVIDGEDIDSLLMGSIKGTVYYIAGYLLRSVLKARTKKNEKVAIAKFVFHNKYDTLPRAIMDLPTRVVDSREIHEGAI